MIEIIIVSNNQKIALYVVYILELIMDSVNFFVLFLYHFH
jgi:hypothetical protein